MRIALIVGVDYYEKISRLHGCVNDAYNVNSVLARNDGGSVNFETKLLTSSSSVDAIDRGSLRDKVEELFKADAEIALLYFAGHGYFDSVGGYILTSECKRGDDGLALSEILKLANSSKARNKVIVLDSCHSGIAGTSELNDTTSVLNQGVTILTASTKEQYASEEDGSGVFTNLFVDALTGSASNLLGEITPGSVYAHIDQSLGGWEQRPVFKTNVTEFVSLRNVTPSIELDDLHKITNFFPRPGHVYKLDPTYEPELKGRDEGMPPPDPKNTEIFAILQKYNRLNLLKPEGAPHMWNAAMESKGCKLTALGEHYRRLVQKGRL